MDGRGQQLRSVRAGPPQYLDVAGLDHGLEIDPEKAQLLGTQRQADRPRLARPQVDLGESSELEQRPCHAGDLVVREQKYRLLRRSRSLVAHVDANLHGVDIFDIDRSYAQVGQHESSVAEPVAEKEQGFIRRVQILAGVMILGVRGPAAGPLAEE